MFIAIEGIDTCGKGTQTKLLADRLEAKRFKFPDGETPIGKYIYDHLFERWYAGVVDENHDNINQMHLDAMVFQCMQLANRLEHAMKIAQTLHTLGKPVVADRYIASGLVYGGADGLDVDYLKKVHEWLPQPDLNILLEISPEVAIERMKVRGDKLDRYENIKFLEEVSKRYRQLWMGMKLSEGERKWVILDGSKGIPEVQADIVAAARTLKEHQIQQNIEGHVPTNI
jgi:dTMP kinase